MRWGIHTIRVRVAAVLSLTLGLALLGYLSILVPKFKQNAIDESCQNLTQNAHLLSQHYASFVERAQSELEAIARYPSLKTMEKNSLDETLQLLNSTTQFFNYFFVVTLDGVWVSYPDRPILISDSIPVENRDWINAVGGENRTIFLDVLRSKVGTLVSGLATPIRDNQGKPIGVLRGVLVLSEKNAARDLLARSRGNSIENAFIVGSNGWLLAHSSIVINYENYVTYNFKDTEPVAAARNSPAGCIKYMRDQKNWLAAYTKIPISNWTVVVEETEVLAISGTNSQIGLVITLLIVSFSTALILTLVVFNVMLRSLSQLVAYVEAEQPLDKMSSRHDEIGVIARKIQSFLLNLREANSALKRSHEQFSRLVSESVDGIAIIDEQGSIIEWNPACENLSGLPASEATGQKIWAVQAHLASTGKIEDAAVLAAAQKQQVLHMLQTGETPDSHTIHDLPIHLPNGNLVHVQSTIFAIPTDRGFMLGSILRDVTEEKRIEEAFRQSERMAAIGRLAGGVAHDFNNQLAGITGFADILQTRVKDNPSLLKYVDGILTCCERSAALTSQLLAYAYKGKYENKEVDLHTLISEVVMILSRSLPKKVRITERFAAKTSVIRGNPNQLQNALLNLALNARDAMPDGGEIVFATHMVELNEAHCSSSPFDVVAGQYVCVSVKDNGVGIESATLTHIFEPFFTTKARGQGTGLGLAAVYGTIRNHGGCIRVNSESGKGTLFEMCFPLTQSEASPKPCIETEPVSAAKLPSLRILLVEDEDAVRTSLETQLLDFGHQPVSFACGDAALEYYGRTHATVDITIIDLVMPGMSGFEVAAAFRAIDSRAKIILISGYEGEEKIRQAVAQLGVQVLMKPFRIKDLLIKIAEVVGTSTNRRHD